jgi:type VI secretion system FHA domain protein
VAPSPPPRNSEFDAIGAFLDGAGMSGMDDARENPEAFMRLIGEIYREMVVGLHQALVARSTIKNELRVERTVIGAFENNPLKYSGASDEAMRALLEPPRSSFLGAPEAVREGFADLAVHEMATMSGVRAALMAVISYFDPENVQDTFASKSLLGTILPPVRKVRYWGGYLKLYDEIVREAEQDLDSRFLAAFARAYTTQVEKLSKSSDKLL